MSLDLCVCSCPGVCRTVCYAAVDTTVDTTLGASFCVWITPKKEREPDGICHL